MIGLRIKSLREEHGLTQKELADFLGVTPKAVSFYELEQRSPSWDMVVKLANKFNVTTDYLLGKSEDVNSAPPQHTKIDFQLFGPKSSYDQLSPEGKAKVDEYILFIKQQEEKAKQND